MSRRTRSDIKRMREQWQKPYGSLMEDAEKEQTNLEEFFEVYRE